jgi:ATP-dependent DNA helicase RecQ
VVGGRDTLALLPTGGGKSAIYQLAGIERPGTTLVISPLLALQQDQLDGLVELGLPAAALNSTVAAGEREAALSAFERGEIEFLLLAPEQLARDDVLARLAAARPSLFVVDEAHCVSEWGPDFRPEYRRLGAARAHLGGPPILALTATASPPVRDDIVRWLGLRNPLVVVRGFDRPEIFLGVERVPDQARKRASLLTWVREADLPGIVYVATRRAAGDVSAALTELGLSSQPYHAGLGARRRRTVLDAFMADGIDVVVATIAFGMGVDKPNVRFVAHHDPSDSLEAYHQEIGRAGRDGQPARAQLFFDPADLGLRRFQGLPPPLPDAQVRRVIARLRDAPAAHGDLTAAARSSPRRTQQIVARLEDLAAVTVDPTGLVEPTEAIRSAQLGSLAAEVVAEQERRRRHARSRVELLRGYAETEGCRRRFLLNALGEEYEAPCGNCDKDLAAEASQRATESAEETADEDARVGGAPSPLADADPRGGPFRLGDPVVHPTFGSGEVSRVEGDRVIVRFDDVGYRTLALDAVLEAGLLSRR